ncbi:MAG: histidine kinase [Flavipsychrobacter sp.]|nr:histidine kinase [Flavipsychrobacter sp.]
MSAKQHTTTYRLKDNWIRFIGIPLIAFTSHIIFFNEQHYEEERFGFWQIFLISLAEAVLLWETNRLVLLYFHKRYPEGKDGIKRIIGILIGCMLVTILVRYLNIWFYDKTLFWGYLFPPEGYLYNILIALLYVVIVVGIYEGLYYFREWKRTFEEKEALERASLTIQLESLKAQINPHFLFNNLGSLASLITEDQERAVEFVRQLSSVYRYVLKANENHLVPLHMELDFLEHYFRLLKTRFEDGIELEIHISEQYGKWQLPPLTLQVLLENVIKHNSILPDQPLLVKLYTTKDGKLVMENNRQPKLVLIGSEKIGLSNLRKKYELLHEGTVLVEETSSLFKVTIPLIKKENYALADSGR